MQVNKEDTLHMLVTIFIISQKKCVKKCMPIKTYRNNTVLVDQLFLTYFFVDTSYVICYYVVVFLWLLIFV